MKSGVNNVTVVFSVKKNDWEGKSVLGVQSFSQNYANFRKSSSHLHLVKVVDNDCADK